MAKIGEIAGYKQLYLSEVDWRRPENRTKNPWKGKTIEKVGFTNDGDSNDKMFIILFTDKTFIALICLILASGALRHLPAHLPDTCQRSRGTPARSSA